MYEYLDSPNTTKAIGSFSLDKNADFKDGVKHLFEGFQSTYEVDPIGDLGKLLKLDTMKEAYKEALLGDVMHESTDDPYLAMMPQKLEQLFENSSLEIIKESGIANLSPIVGITLPVLKKSYIEGHAKDIVMSEVPTKPIVKVAYERRFLKNKAGEKFYIPDVFYNANYKNIMNQGKGKPINNEWYPKETGTVPFQDLNILEESGGSVSNRDSLAYDFCVQAVKIEVDGDLQTINVNVQPNMAADSSFTYRVKTKNAAGTEVSDILMGQVDWYHGLVSVGSTKGLIKKVQFGGHLSNENNTETIELDRERQLMEWKIPDGVRINTGLTLEKIRDYKALFDFDMTTEIISDMSTVLAQTEDSDILGFLNDSFDKWKSVETLPFGYDLAFAKEAFFNCEPPSNKFVTRSSWVDTELKYDLNRFIDELKVTLRNQDLMFVLYAHPNWISLIQDNVRWIIDENTKIGGIQLDYRFGVLTANKNRIHVISTMKCPKERGIRAVAYPLTKEIITFKHYKYSLNIENAYRNPITPLIPNVMGTSRYITTEVLPVQGEFYILDGEFAMKKPGGTTPGNGPEAEVAAPSVDIVAGTYSSAQTVTVSCTTPGVTMYYTVDGSEPDTNATSVTNNGTISIAASATLKIVAIKNGVKSTVTSVEYTITT